MAIFHFYFCIIYVYYVEYDYVMKPKWTFVRIWGSPAHVGAANNVSVTWGWIASSRLFQRTAHFGATIKLNNIQYGFGIYRQIPWEKIDEASSSHNEFGDEVL